MLGFIARYEDAFFKTKWMFSIACTLLITSPEAEQSFSSLKLIKTQLRATMDDSHLSSIAVISVHKRGKEIDLDRVVDDFVKLYPNC